MNKPEFAAAMQRMKEALGCETQRCLAMRLGLTSSAIAIMCYRNRFSDGVLLSLVREYNLNPVWVLHGGEHPKFLRPSKE